MAAHSPPALRPRLIRPGEGQTVTAGADALTVKLSDVDTDGAFTVGLALLQPGQGLPPHVHHREDELFIVLDGELEVWTPEGTFTARGGDLVFLPAEAPHTHRNLGPGPVRFYWFANPSGFEHFSADYAAALGSPSGLGPAQLAELGEQYGVEFLPGTP
ncbi:cupin domain-containing protein [Deinococcus sonorensis]|uniref:Cupin domain-containing protein n=2 Tax=Deinococcus sonorensis TaxID=309891 RepID=A0AAU7U5D5_9DEIO